MEEMGTMELFVSGPKGNSSLERLCCRWKRSIRMDLKEIGCMDVDWIGFWLFVTGSCGRVL
jgi:hypothetical protein